MFLLAASVTSYANLKLTRNKTEGIINMDKKPTFIISEFSKRARVSVRTLRYYEEIGLIVPTDKNSSGHRLYGLAELAKLQHIQSLKFLGYSLQEIKGLMDDDVDISLQLNKSLPLQHKLLTEKIDELERAIGAVEHVQNLLNQGKPMTWTVLSSLLFQIEHEEDQKEWIKTIFQMKRSLINFFHFRNNSANSLI